MSDEHLKFLREHNLYDNEENHLAELQQWVIDQITRMREFNQIAVREVGEMGRQLGTLQGEVDQIRREIPDEFLLVPPDGGDVKTHEAVHWMREEIQKLRKAVRDIQRYVNNPSRYDRHIDQLCEDAVGRPQKKMTL
jgi:hypothetical protein